MKWEDVCRSPYRTKEEADAAEAKLAPIREARAQADHARKEAVREARYAAMLERQRAERKALEEELERTLPQRARDAAYREYLYKFPPGNQEDAN